MGHKSNRLKAWEETCAKARKMEENINASIISRLDNIINDINAINERETKKMNDDINAMHELEIIYLDSIGNVHVDEREEALDNIIDVINAVNEYAQNVKEKK